MNEQTALDLIEVLKLNSRKVSELSTEITHLKTIIKDVKLKDNFGEIIEKLISIESLLGQ